jgi:hypothetical protein
LVTTSKQNRELLVGLVRTEVDRAVGRMGFVREDELAALRTRLENLEAKVRAEERTSTSSSAKKSTASSETKAPKAKKKVVPE